MEDFSKFTVIPENFDYEEVLAKNYAYKNENNNLKVLLFMVVIGVIGASLHLVNEELNKKTRSN